MLRIAQIYLFPIKSCGGFAVESAELETRGFAGDRRYMLVDERGSFLTQRTQPRLARIATAPVAGGFVVSSDSRSGPELPPALSAGRTRRVTVWRDEVEALVAPRDVNEWFSAALGTPCELVYANAARNRGVKAGYGRAEDDLSFADGSPVLLISTESLRALNAKLEAAVDMIRFRPNLVATADRAFAEDSWRHIRVGDAAFDVAWPCSRCTVPTVDPDTGIRDPRREPLRTLNSFRSTPDGTMFGQNLIPRELGWVQVGDRINVVESADS